MGGPTDDAGAPSGVQTGVDSLGDYIDGDIRYANSKCRKDMADYP